MMKALVTSGPTYESIDPVRFIGNRSSGKQGHALAAALAEVGFEVTLVSGPVHLPDPKVVNIVQVESAEDMLAASENALPVDVAVFAAAVGDWRVAEPANQKLKKDGSREMTLTLTENPDILHTISHHAIRPKLVIGFAAETENVMANARAKLERKGCDWIIANQVGGGLAFDAEENEVTLITAEYEQIWPKQSKTEIAKKLAEAIRKQLS